MQKRSHIRFIQRSRPGDTNRLGTLIAVGVLVVLAGVVMGHVAQAAESPKLPPAKAQLAAREQQEIAAAQAHARPKAGVNQPLAAQAAPVRQAGIIEMHQGPFPATQFTVRNFWQGPVGANWVLAYAGAKRNPDGSSGAGALVLYTETATATGDYDLNYLGTYTAPAEANALTITGVSGAVMQVRSDAGSMFTFDLQMSQFR